MVGQGQSAKLSSRSGSPIPGKDMRRCSRNRETTYVDALVIVQSLHDGLRRPCEGRRTAHVRCL